MAVNHVQKTVLERMFRDTIIGGKHTAVENLKKGFPKHMRGEVEDEVHKLINRGFILPKPTSYGMQVSLNPRMIEEIKKILKYDYLLAVATGLDDAKKYGKYSTGARG